MRPVSWETTHSAPAPKASSAWPSARPIRTLAATRLRSGSMRTSRNGQRPYATHSEPAPNAMPLVDGSVSSGSSMRALLVP